MRSRGRSQAPISMGSGILIAVATTSQISVVLCRDPSTALETLETTFHQDLNGDGVIGVPSPTSPAEAASSSSATFTGSTLTLDASSRFSGQIVGFAGDGTLQGSDQIDLRGVDYNSIHSTYDNSTGVLAVNDGTNTTDLHFLGTQG